MWYPFVRPSVRPLARPSDGEFKAMYLTTDHVVSFRLPTRQTAARERQSGLTDPTFNPLTRLLTNIPRQPYHPFTRLYQALPHPVGLSASPDRIGIEF